MPAKTPEVTRIYQNHHLDSTRWDVWVPRDDDIVVTTSYKSGTTFTQQILLGLLYPDVDQVPGLQELSPWPDARFRGATKEELAKQLEDLSGRRFIKSHLPLDGLPWYPQVKYVVVARDPRDVFMSFYNHYWNYTDFVYELMNEQIPGRVGDPLPRCPDDPRVAWKDWITRGWFEWESEGWPFWSNLHHTQTYWDYRHLPNFLLLHYADMIADHAGAVRTIADFVEAPASDEVVERVVADTAFAAVKKRADRATEESDDGKLFFKGGMSAFFFKGSNGRWRDVLTEDDLALYEQARERVLSPDCAKWLETGGPVPG